MEVNVRLHFRVTESPDCKFRLVLIETFPAGINHLLPGSALLVTFTVLKILLCKIAVLVQGLAMGQHDRLSCVRL